MLSLTALARPERPGRRLRVGGMVTAGLICAVWMVLRPPSQDFASGDFRARLFDRGTYLWNNLWFGGHPLPGYGMVSPMLSAVFGVVPIAVISVFVSTWCFTLLVERLWETYDGLPDPMLAVVLFACGAGVNLWGGRLTFGPAVMFGTACFLALQRNHRVVAIVCAALCGLCSPVGALSLVMVLTALWFAEAGPRKLLVATGIAAVVPIGSLIVIFPESGWYPFTWQGLAMLIGALAVVGWFGRDIPAVRWAVGIYGAVAITAFIVKSPLGGNVVRLGWLAAGPAAALTIRRHRRVVLPMFAVFTLIWSWAYVRIAFEPANASASAEYYESLGSYLATLPQPQRVEVVPTETFGQADELALETMGIARGWERQLDLELNPEFYDENFDADMFHRWLLEDAVSVVALPSESVRVEAQPEADIVLSEPDFLRLTWSNADWKVYEVVDATPLADHGARVVDVQPESLTIEASRTGWSLVRFRYTDLYQVEEDGVACLEESPDGWIRMLVHEPGTIHLRIALSSEALLPVGEACV